MGKVKRIMILGPGNSGKSTLATKLGGKLDIPVYHLDKYFWNTNWKDKSHEEKQKIHKQLIEKDKWIIDGGFTKLLDQRIARADTVIYLDFPRRVIIPRWFLRMKKYKNSTRPDMAEGNIERFNWLYFSWLIKNKKPEKQLLKTISNNKKIFVLKNPKQVDSFLRQR